MNKFYINTINKLIIDKIKFILIGSHALELLNNKYNLNLNLNMSNKDLDLVIEESSKKYLIDNYNCFQKNTALINKIVLYDNSYRVDFITKLNRTIKIDNNILYGIDYSNLINYCYLTNNINIVDLKVYYALVKSTGLTKYKSIRDTIINKYPSIIENIIA